MRSEEGMTEGEMPDEGMLDVGKTDESIRKPKPRKIRAAVVIGALALGLLGGGGMIAYFTHTNLDLTIQGLETAYTAEQTAAKRLVRRAQELSKTSAQAQARAKALEERQKASEAERGNLEVRNKKLATASGAANGPCGRAGLDQETRPDDRGAVKGPAGGVKGAAG